MLRSVRNREKFIRLLKQVMVKFSEVQFAYLFGSYAEGKAMPVSDLDIAILTKDKKVIPYLTAELSKVLGFPEEKISIVNLEDAGPILKLRILSRGIKLIDRGMFEEKIRMEIEPETIDLLENEKAGFQAWLKGNPLDEALLKRIITQISEDVEDLKELLKRDSEKVKLDKILRKAFERTVQTSIEGAIDLLRHIISGLNLGIAEHYKDYVEISREKGVISVETAKNLLELIPIRHSLVHRYREVSYEKLWLEAKRIVETIPKLQDEVKKYLQKQI